MVRQGGSRVFFDVVGQMQASRLISDASEMATVVQAIVLDAFDGIKGSLDGIFSSVGTAIEAVREPALALGESQIYFRKFFDFDGVAQYESAIIDLGVAFGFTGTEALEAGARMAQLGGLFGSGESIVAGTEVGMAFGMIGGMETEDAQQRLISLAQQTGFMYEGVGKKAFFAMGAEEQRQVVLRNSLYVLDQLNTVENNSVATMEQLSTVMNQFSASASIANMSIAEQAALSATLVESGESASKAGRGLRQMLLRVASDTGGAATALHEYGVATQDVNGDLVGLTRIMQQLKDNGFDELDSAQQMQLATSVAGANHATRFIKLMVNMDRVTTLTADAISRESTALSEMNTIMQTATFQANQMAAAQETLSAAIGQELLPAMTRAEGVSFSMKQSFLEMMQTNPDNTGLNASLDNTVSFLTTGASNGMIMANAMYELGGGAFEAFMNVQSLIISVRVYRVIMKQNLEIQRMMTQGLLGQKVAMQQMSNLENIKISQSGILKQSEYFKNQLLKDGLMIQKESISFGNIKNRQLAVEKQIATEILGSKKASNHAEQELARLKGMTAAMTLSQAETVLAANNTEILALQAKAGKIQSIIALKGEEHMIDGVTAIETQNSLTLEINALNNKRTVIQQVVAGHTQLANVEGREMGVMTQNTNARIQAIAKKREEFLQTLMLLRASGHLTKAEHAQILATMNATKANVQYASSAQRMLGVMLRIPPQAMSATAAMNRLGGAAGLASMSLMFMGDSEDAMQASMILMVASMIPAIFSMSAMGAATDKATFSMVAFQAVSTGGLALIAIGASLLLARKLMKNHTEDLVDSTVSIAEGFDFAQNSASNFAFELDKPGGATDLMLDFGSTTEESMDKAEKSIQDFMSAREELFFGFSASRMNQTLFDQLVNQGVGELYYRTEVNVNNQFFGLTTDEMVNQISSQVEERIVARAG
tara:strand:- start:7402 stop:10233 length:2832 start_codon:yes stop_codon:yes gene_type:complete